MRIRRRNWLWAAPAGALLLFASLFAPQAAAAEGDAPIRIGIAQIVQHPSLDQARRGFIDELTEAGYEEGVDVVYQIEDAQGDIVNANVIAQQFARQDVDLILAIATPMAQAVANVTQEIPILITAVTDPLDARLVKSYDRPGTNVTGTSDLTPVAQQLDLLQEIVPDAEQVGIVYNAGESNSVVQVELAREAAEERGLELVEATVTNSSEVYQAALSLRGRVDAVYVPTDNTVVSALESVILVCEEENIPLIAGEKDSVKRGAVGTVGIDYYELGHRTGAMAIEVLNGRDPATMPIQYQEDVSMTLNPSAARRMGVELPDELVAQAAELVGE